MQTSEYTVWWASCRAKLAFVGTFAAAIFSIGEVGPTVQSNQIARGDEDRKSSRAAVPLYGVFEEKVTNTRKYSNPFDFRVIELQTEFTSPSGRKSQFFGFYDGNGNGGQQGSVWAFRWMPDEVGTWRYRFMWSDGTPGGEGTFDVVDTGLPGPLKVADDNPWYFMDSRGKPFHARPYGMHHYLAWTATHQMQTELARFRQTVQRQVVDRGYNMIMWPDMGDRTQKGTSTADGDLPVGRGQPRRDEYDDVPVWKPTGSWWLNTTDKTRFSIAAFRANEDALTFCRMNGVYVFTFSGMVDQCSEYEFDKFQVFLRYFVARMAPFYNYFGWSPVWEWMDIWKPEEVTEIMQYVHEHDPWKRLLTAHDNSHSTFTGWLGFSMRQAPARDLFGGNSRRAGGQQIPDANGSGGIGDPFFDRPIIGSEDQWESPIADKWPGWDVPRTGVEVMRSSWGALMAGVIPVYDEWNVWTKRPPGNGEGEPYVRRMFDFWYTHTEYRRYVQLNDLVSREDGQIASGCRGEEYVIYDENGGDISLQRVLSEVPSEHVFSVTWFDPATGVDRLGETVAGGSDVSLRSPFTGDSVLFLKRTASR